MRRLLPLLLLSASCADVDASRPPSVVLVCIDTLRADHLGCYGYERPTSPAMDRLAASGALFLDANAPSPWTLPSHVSLLTGRYPSRHGVVRDDNRLSKLVPSIATVYREEGYATRAIVNAHYLVPKYGLKRGFEGAYEFVDDAGRSFEVPIPAFSLSMPNMVH